jgi:RNA polymerase sigma-70 factor, ECF subfamily
VNAASSHDAVLAAAARGDDAALAVLVRLYHERVYRFGLRVCRDGFDADDAVQEAFTALARRPEVLRDPGALSWLFRVVRNLCRRLLRPFARERRVLGERTDVERVAAHGDVETALERWQLIHAVHAAIAELDAAYREVLVLRDLEGLSGAETCAALGLETAAMKTRLHRARQQLRQKIQSQAQLWADGL